MRFYLFTILIFLIFPVFAFSEDYYSFDSTTALNLCIDDEGNQNKCHDMGAISLCWNLYRGVSAKNQYFHPVISDPCNTSHEMCLSEYEASGICSPVPPVAGYDRSYHLALMGLAGVICGFLPMYVLAKNL